MPEKHNGRQSKSHKLRRLHEASYGSMIPISSLQNGNFDNYTKLFIEIPLRYKAILDYADKLGLVLSGYSYEKGINETVVDRIEDYIIQIEIPIRSSFV